MRELKTMRWYAILVGACFAFHAADAGSSDIEEGLNNCCEEGSQWGTSRSGCDGLPLPQLPATQSCRIAQEICCRSALRQRLCDAGKAAARGGRPCHDDQSECVGDTYRDCCDGCRLGLAAVKEGAPCRPQTFSLGLPWDDAFYQCCSGRDDLPDDTSATGHDNDVPAGPGDRGHDVPTCPSGQELHNDGRTCVPVKTNNGGAHERPCDRNNPCEQICHVVNSSPVCKCHEGYRLEDDLISCADIDECSDGMDDCDESREQCMNTPGSFKCIPNADSVALPDVGGDVPQCDAGFKYNTAIKDCIDVDECSEGLDDCELDTQSCLNTHGGYQCLSKESKECPGGYVWKDEACVDVNECTEGLSNCAEGEACVNGVGSFSCVPVSNSGCTPGYRRNTDTGRCEDINECEEYVHSCKGHLQCVNTRGSYLCERRPDASPAGPSSSASKGLRPDDPTCGAGYRTDPLTRDCRDIDECQEDKPCGTNEVCRNTYGGFECTCNHGYKRDQASGTCKDVNECQYGGHNCQIGFRCDNTPGSFTCVRISGCGTGYTVNAATGQCEDDDECALGIHNCGPNFECQNTEGSFRCVRSTCPVGSRRLDDGSCQATNCPPGHTSDSFGNCADINECAHNRSLCGRYHRCINTVGSYQCESLLSCTPGYEPNSQGNQCLDIDECATNTHDCRVNQTCSNMPGSYVCECPIGFRMNSFRDCEDIDECTRFAGRVCSVNSECINTPGSYTCHCKPGFKRGYDERTCIDVNECEAESHACQHSCINTWGSYQCICKKGFRLAEDQRMCVDVDECEMWKGRGSLCIGTCVNEPGSYSCTCPEGYVLNNDKRTCQDIDECERGDICRGENEVCLNTRGGYRCNKLDCPPGYFRDADHKTRCKREKRDCAPEDQECRKEPLSLSFNYFTLPHNMKIPPSGHQDFFTMRGPRFSFSTVHFELELVEARASSRAHGVEVATREHFFLRNTGVNEAMVSIVRPLQGPQDIQLELRTSIYHNGLYSGSALAKIFIYVTEHEF
ncbi:fibulin-1-like isoform X5 [Dermacentor silvarum]|uniref:fibulin-1-like isoform X5 n=1 Tax=Dermacentor silvarum TaxID=543639 RepID=UPI001899F8D3|nr:fibulin-1-like isoform X5 [Dermacentor silvarum]